MAGRWAKALAGLLAVTASAGAAAEERIAGVWRNAKDAATVKLSACSDRLCGDFTRQPPGYDLRMVDGFRRTAETRWEGGRFKNLNDGAVYVVELELLDPRTMKVRGCWLSFCDTGIWSRVE